MPSILSDPIQLIADPTIIFSSTSVIPPSDARSQSSSLFIASDPPALKSSQSRASASSPSSLVSSSPSSSTAPKPISALPTTTPTQTPHTESNKLLTGVKAGIGVVAAIALLAFLAAIYFTIQALHPSRRSVPVQSGAHLIQQESAPVMGKTTVTAPLGTGYPELPIWTGREK
ncbi:hypothetical protein BDV95DRAFT_595661 [Massariosphaeria phaeospora]|uniref:Uncharacterized protein n=1 Tax=Massariosphaeria phaeospora TaxID=100035 RepID=A0A7C8M6E0_9PLEO|nr:hypothetical protein BDV95DRAFT_595661 [Massariosphaeria phaeospora]